MKRELWYSVVVRDRQGKVLSRERRRSRSFLRRWNETIYVQTTGKNIDDIIAPHYINLNLKSQYTNGLPDEKSIIVGTSDTPVLVTNTGLGAKIAHGTGAGELSYQAATVNDSIVSAPHCSFFIDRAFVNNSGGEITAKEAGMGARVKGVTYYACMVVIRDVFGTPQVIPNGGSLSMTYTLRVTA